MRPGKLRFDDEIDVSSAPILPMCPPKHAEHDEEVNTAPACGLSLARVTGDQVRDLAPRWRAEVAAALGRAGAPEAWQRAVQELTPLSEAERVEQLGDDLPIGLRLLDP